MGEKVKVERFVWMGINFALEKDECDVPSILGGRLIVVIIQWGGWVNGLADRKNTCSLQNF